MCGWKSGVKGILLVLLVVLTRVESGNAQSRRAAIEYASLMNVGFSSITGGFRVEGLQMIDPALSGDSLKFVVANEEGEKVLEVPLGISEPPFPGITDLHVQGNTMWEKFGRRGRYVISILADGRPLTSLTFTAEAENSGDIHNPRTTFTRDGPWRDLAFFSVRVDDENKPLVFNWWSSRLEVPEIRQLPMLTIHLMDGDEEIATSSHTVIPTTGWEFQRKPMWKPKEHPGDRTEHFTLAMLTKNDGEYEMVLRVNGRPFKAYGFTTSGGAIERHPRSSPGFKPMTDFLTDRRIETSRENRERSVARTYWVERKR